MAARYEVQEVVQARNSLGEGVLWSAREGLVYWTDIEGQAMWTYDPAARRTTTTKLETGICSFAFRAGGGLLVAETSGLATYDPKSGNVRKLCEIVGGTDGVRLNDGRCDRQGRFVVGELDGQHKKRARVFITDRGLEPRKILDGIATSNSTCFSLDGKTMYFADTPERVIWSFDYDPDDGTPSKRRVFCDLHDQPGRPDGSTIDAEGFLWNAQWDGSRVVRWDPKGRIDRIIELPCRFPTCMAFGGENLNVLYVTSARKPGPSGAPGDADGSLFAVELSVRGLPETDFLG